MAEIRISFVFTVLRRAVLVAMIVSAALFVSCGGSSEKKATETSAQTAAQTEAAQKAAEAEAAEEQAKAEAAAAEAAAAQLSPEEQAKAAEIAEKAKAEAAVAEQAKAEAARVVALDVPDPVLATAGGVFNAPVSVVIDKKLKEAKISYTIDGSAPSPTSGKTYSAPFTVSASAVVRAIAYVPGGKKSKVVSADYTIGEVCVASGGSGDGRRTSPFGSIAAGIAKAKSLSIGTVKLGAGVLTESFEVTAPIALSGSWKSGFAAQGKDRTVVKALASDSTSKKAPGYAVRVAGKAADSATKFERIEFRGAESSYGAGIVIADGAAPEFASCSSFGGSGSYGYGAVVLSAATPTFRSCRLDGGEGATSYGLSADNAKATIASSLALAGTGTVGGYGVAATDAKLTVSDSVLAGNSANVSYGAAFYNSKGTTIDGCTIVGGKGKDVCGIFISTSDPAITNCVVWSAGEGKSYGITANYGESAPSKLSGTVFLGCASGIYFEAGTKTAYSAVNAAGRLSAADGKTPNKPQGDGNAIATFALGAAPSYAIPSDAPGKAGARSDLITAISR